MNMNTLIDTPQSMFLGDAAPTVVAPVSTGTPNIAIRIAFSDGKTSTLGQQHWDDNVVAIKARQLHMSLDSAASNPSTASRELTGMLSLMQPGDKFQILYNDKVYDEWTYPTPKVAPAPAPAPSETNPISSITSKIDMSDDRVKYGLVAAGIIAIGIGWYYLK